MCDEQAMKVIIDPVYRWTKRERGALTVHSVGDAAEVDVLLELLGGQGTPSSQRVAETLRRRRGQFSAIVTGPTFVLACVDRVRSYPVFYSDGRGQRAVCNSARRLQAAENLYDVDETSVVEFTMAGYVTGRNTVFEHLYQLRPGEFLLWQADSDGLTVHRYYRYVPSPVPEARPSAYVEELGTIVDRVFDRIVEKAGGAPIWVPLSGGYDSRAIICKLHERGYDNLTAFSYGPPHNHDAKAAKHVAETLRIPWKWVPSHRGESRRYFQQEDRRAYWEFADGLSVIPSMREDHALVHLREHGAIQDNALIINGQTGDYLTGGHIPVSLMRGAEVSEDALLKAIIDKHWSLWVNLKTDSYLSVARQRIREELRDWPPRSVGRNDLIAQYESWEYQERQSKFVVNGQRLYDFLELSWLLPYWDGIFLDFWERVPFEEKFKQKLWLTYLKLYDYKALFKDFDPFIWRWQTHMMWVLPLAKIVGLALGTRSKELVYKYSGYFGHYTNHYGVYGLGHFLKTIHNARSPISFQTELWLRENLALPSPNRIGDCGPVQRSANTQRGRAQ